jgi:hypothetical protein
VRPVASLRVQREAWAGIGRLLLCVMCRNEKDRRWAVFLVLEALFLF